MAAEAASFKTSILWISFGLTDWIPPEMGYPSTTTKGLDAPEIEEAALIWIFGAAPGEPSWFWINTPDNLPARASSTRATWRAATSSPPILATAPVNWDLLREP